VEWNYCLILFTFAGAYAVAYYLVTDEIRRHIGPQFLISWVIPITVGALVQNMILYQLALFLSFIFTVRNPTDIVLRYALMLLLLPNAPLYIGTDSWYVGTMKSSGVLAIAAVVATFMHSGGKNSATQPGKILPPDLLALGLFSLMLFWGVGFDNSHEFVRGAIYWGNLWLLYIPLRLNILGRNEYRLALAIIATAAMILSVLALYEAREHWALYDTISGLLDFHRSFTNNINFRGGLMRASVTMSGPLMLASVLSFALLATYISRQYFRTGWGWVAAMVLISFGNLACQSRSNAVGGLITLFLLLVLMRKWKAIAGLVGAAAVAGALILAMPGGGKNADGTDSALFASGEKYEHNGVQYSDYRTLLFARGVEVGMRHPILGQPLYKSLQALSDIEQGQHIVDLVNSYLVIFLISGFPGLIFFVGLIFLTFGQMIATRTRNETREAKSLRAFLLVSFGYMYVQLAYVSIIDRVPFLLLFPLVGIRIYLLTRGSEIGDQAPGVVAAKPISLVERAEPGLVLSNRPALVAGTAAG